MSSCWQEAHLHRPLVTDGATLLYRASKHDCDAANSSRAAVQGASAKVPGSSTRARGTWHATSPEQDGIPPGASARGSRCSSPISNASCASTGSDHQARTARVTIDLAVTAQTLRKLAKLIPMPRLSLQKALVPLDRGQPPRRPAAPTLTSSTKSATSGHGSSGKPSCEDRHLCVRILRVLERHRHPDPSTRIPGMQAKEAVEGRLGFVRASGIRHAMANAIGQWTRRRARHGIPLQT